MANEIGWELYRTFLAVLQEGSLSAAARAIGITQPTAGRHIAALEAAFGQALFIRSQAGVLPTEAALAMRSYAETMQSTAAAMRRAVARGEDKGVAGTVRVSASEVVGVEVLPPALAQLRRENPHLRIELVPTNRMQNLLQHEADVAVRMAVPRQDSLIARHVGALKVGLFSHVDYLRQHGTPLTPAELVDHALIGFDEETPFLRNARNLLPAWHREAFSLRSDSDLAQLALIRAACGIGACQVALARRDAALVQVLPDQVVFKLDTWVTMHEDLRNSPRCRVTFDALVACLQAHIASELQ